MDRDFRPDHDAANKLGNRPLRSPGPVGEGLYPSLSPERWRARIELRGPVRLGPRDVSGANAALLARRGLERAGLPRGPQADRVRRRSRALGSHDPAHRAAARQGRRRTSAARSQPRPHAPAKARRPSCDRRATRASSSRADTSGKERAGTTMQRPDSASEASRSRSTIEAVEPGRSLRLGRTTPAAAHRHKDGT
jgi:hypothetical protein